MKNIKNKKLILSTLAAFLLAPFVVLAYPRQINVGAATTSVLSTVSFLFGAFAIIMFITTGFLFLVARGDAAKTAEARKAFLWGVIGVIVALLSFGMTAEISRILGV